MDTFAKNRWLFWILLVLIVLNLSMMITHLVVQKKSEKTETTGLSKPGWALQQELSLTPDQTDKVNAINATYRENIQPVTEAIREKKSELIRELASDDTDTSQAYRLAEEISVQQKQLQDANIKQFLELKKVCTPEQVQKLSALYSEFYGCQNAKPEQGKGRGQGGGMRHRYRYGQQQLNDSLK